MKKTFYGSILILQLVASGRYYHNDFDAFLKVLTLSIKNEDSY
ncbi:hypothetical protein [Candidatus Uabimicrobium amorphum]|uniref:Uncharacterized protein n=1 Tax=Uabimicrobium amorphum TaxID=2596890 RepID=A0A5S9IUL7_UABAM|nr:hypothetical protein [Candidatus Uabimicrobium amorphum]BBM86875.1 hypothetical protein UABAM_05277 [Candidatus Uabimicrobium amorphum]